MSDYTFINKNVEIYKGQEALVLLQRKNDLYFLEDEGVLKVPYWRWSEAQVYQYNQQMVRGLERTEDRNTTHLECLDHYRALRGIRFAQGIELGCGPFTNIQYIAGVQDVVLVDPLIMEYVNHPNGHIDDLPVSRMIPSSIEDMPQLGQFDLVVMINVLEHCRDGWTVLKRVRELVASNGYLVLGERCYRDVEALLRRRYDAGHPIRPTADFLRRFMKEYKHIYFYHTMDRMGTMFYFIGRRNENKPG